MRDIHLHGALGVQFGKHHRFAVETVPEVFEALRVNFPGFVAAIRNGFYRIVLGKTKTNGMALREDQLVGLSIGARAVHIVPTVAGRKRGGIGKVIAGIALVGLSAGAFGAMPILSSSLWTGGATIGQMAGNMGVAMTLGGVATMIAPEQASGDDKKSFTMSGPTSEVKEGGIVPIVYGEVITGGYMISGAVEINGPVSEKTGTLRSLADAIGRPSGG
ncbi:MAG: hypothetical protein ACK46Q_04970 [Hyphomonas sp.]